MSTAPPDLIDASAVARGSRAEILTPLSVLLIEDDDDECAQIEAILAAAGSLPVRVSRADSVAAGIGCIRRAEIDCVLLDLRVHDAAGLDGLKAIVAVRPEMAIITLSDETCAHLGPDALRLGAQNCLNRSDLDPVLLERVLLIPGRRNHSRRELDESRDHYRSVVAALGEGVCVQDHEGRILTINGIAADILGSDAARLIGTTTANLPWALFDESGAAVQPADRPGRQCIRTGQPVLGQVFGMRTGDDEMKWIEMDVRPLAGDDGRPYAVVSTMRDVTVRQNAQRALASATRRRELVYEHAGEGYRILDISGRVLEANPPVKVGTGFHADEGPTIFSSLEPAEVRELARMFSSVTGQPGKTVKHDILIRREEGDDSWVEFSLTNYLDEPAVGGLVLNYRNITARREAEESIRFQARLLDTAGQAIIATDRRGRVVFWNQTATDIYGWTAVEATDRFILDVVTPDESDEFLATLADQVANGGGWAGDLWIRHRDGGRLPIFMTTTPVYKSDGELLAVVGVSTDVSERKAAERELARQASHDPLTGLPNRWLLVSRLEELLAERASGGNGVAVLFIDLDRFKVINDGIGHQTGDQVLRAAAARLSAELPNEFIARFGGDEFVVLYHGVDAAGVESVADQILQVFSLPFNVNGNDLFVTASIGVAISADADSSETMLRDADAALYLAKENGRARARVFDERLRDRARRRVSWEAHLRQALERREFRIAYQPIMALEREVPVGFEALIRWDHPVQGAISPVDFIPLAEESGLIVPIGEWVLQAAVAQLAEWQRSLGLADLFMSVNVSTRQLLTPTLIAALGSTLRSSGIDPGRLHLELTETALIQDMERSVKVLHVLKDMGVGLAIDDFGTGYSSLTYLKQLPIDTLKIDRSFVDGLGSDPHDTSIVRAIISLGAALDLNVVAEGVETSMHLTALQRLNCDLAQGFLWNPAMRPEDVPDWLRSQLDGQ